MDPKALGPKPQKTLKFPKKSQKHQKTLKTQSPMKNVSTALRRQGPGLGLRLGVAGRNGLGGSEKAASPPFFFFFWGGGGGGGGGVLGFRVYKGLVVFLVGGLWGV